MCYKLRRTDIMNIKKRLRRYNTSVLSKHTCLFWFVLIVCTTLLGFHLMIKRIIILYLLEIIEKMIFPTIFILDKHKNIFLQIIMDDIK